MKMRPPSKFETVQFGGAMAMLAGIAGLIGSVYERRLAVAGAGVVFLVIGGSVFFLAGLGAHHAETLLRARLQSLRAAIKRFIAENGREPESLRELVSAGYLPRVPADPVRWPSRNWEEVPAPDRRGIIDVHSKSASPALDDTSYRTW